RHALSGTHDLDELFREIAPAYETPFDRSRPLWEARVYEGLADGRAAIFFKLHHADADGVQTNGAEPHKGSWGHADPFGHRIADALRDRVRLDVERAGGVAKAV